MKNIGFLFLCLFISTTLHCQNSDNAKKLLDEVSSKMGAYENMYLDFNQTLINEDAGIKEGDEAPIRGEIYLKGNKYHLNYQGNTLIYDAKKLYVINNDEKEVTISETTMEDNDDGFIYPSKLLTFYKEGYTFEMGKLENSKGRQIQYVTLNPKDSSSEIVKVELGIDAKTKHIYKLIQIGENTSKTIFTITNFKKNQLLSENLFSFDSKKYEEMNYLID